MNTLSLIEASFRKPGDFNSFYPFVEISTVHSERKLNTSTVHMYMVLELSHFTNKQARK
jgi:hypothetical protein